MFDPYVNVTVEGEQVVMTVTWDRTDILDWHMVDRADEGAATAAVDGFTDGIERATNRLMEQLAGEAADRSGEALRNYEIEQEHAE